MALDIRSMIFMSVLLSILLSGVLYLVGVHARHIRGVKHWALANLLYSIGLALAFTPVGDSPRIFLFSGPLLAVAAGLQLTGIQVFEEEARPDWRIPLGAALVSLLINYVFTISAPSITLRIVCNSSLMGLLYALCARHLLINVSRHLRSAYWLTGTAFAILAAVTIARIPAVIVANPMVNYIITPEPINMMVFLVFAAMLIVINFGFVLLVNFRLANDLQLLANRDSLTNALNRRGLEEIGEHLHAHFSRSGGQLAVLMLDIDHFKSVNDRHGHPVGDAVLRELSRIVTATIRAGDYFARYGGEEFCVLLPGSSEEQACKLADRLRHRFAETKLSHGQDGVLQCTLSVGVADLSKAAVGFGDLLAEADKALYRAKEIGRNRVVAASEMERLPENQLDACY